MACIEAIIELSEGESGRFPPLRCEVFQCSQYPVGVECIRPSAIVSQFTIFAQANYAQLLS